MTINGSLVHRVDCMIALGIKVNSRRGRAGQVDREGPNRLHRNEALQINLYMYKSINNTFL